MTAFHLWTPPFGQGKTLGSLLRGSDAVIRCRLRSLSVQWQVQRLCFSKHQNQILCVTKTRRRANYSVGIASAESLTKNPFVNHRQLRPAFETERPFKIKGAPRAAIGASWSFPEAELNGLLAGDYPPLLRRSKRMGGLPDTVL
jgi:hypothetical protein